MLIDTKDNLTIIRQVPPDHRAAITEAGATWDAAKLAYTAPKKDLAKFKAIQAGLTTLDVTAAAKFAPPPVKVEPPPIPVAPAPSDLDRISRILADAEKALPFKTLMRVTEDTPAYIVPRGDIYTTSLIPVPFVGALPEGADVVLHAVRYAPVTNGLYAVVHRDGHPVAARFMVRLAALEKASDAVWTAPPEPEPVVLADEPAPFDPATYVNPLPPYKPGDVLWFQSAYGDGVWAAYRREDRRLYGSVFVWSSRDRDNDTWTLMVDHDSPPQQFAFVKLLEQGIHPETGLRAEIETRDLGFKERQDPPKLDELPILPDVSDLDAAFDDFGEGVVTADIARVAASNVTPFEPSKERIPGTALRKLEIWIVFLDQDIARLLRPFGDNAPTEKRLREYKKRTSEGRKLRLLRSRLAAYIEQQKSGDVANVIARLATKTTIEWLHDRADYPQATPYSQTALNNFVKEGVTETNYAATRAAWLALGDSRAGDETDAEKLDRLQKDILMRSPDGYFPTPPELVTQLLDCLMFDIEPERILEPSAGTGHIARELRERFPDTVLHVVEAAPACREILRLQGFEMVDSDFATFTPDEPYDVIVMNPPFEKGQDMEHVRRAYGMLTPGGGLAAVMSNGWRYRKDKQATAFREWLEALDYEVRDVPAGAFKTSGTGVSATMVWVKKPSSDDAPLTKKPLPIPVEMPSGTGVPSLSADEIDAQIAQITIEVEAAVKALDTFAPPKQGEIIAHMVKRGNKPVRRQYRKVMASPSTFDNPGVWEYRDEVLNEWRTVVSLATRQRLVTGEHPDGADAPISPVPPYSTGDVIWFYERAGTHTILTEYRREATHADSPWGMWSHRDGDRDAWLKVENPEFCKALDKGETLSDLVTLPPPTVIDTSFDPLVIVPLPSGMRSGKLIGQVERLISVPAICRTCACQYDRIAEVFIGKNTYSSTLWIYDQRECPVCCWISIRQDFPRTNVIRDDDHHEIEGEPEAPTGEIAENDHWQIGQKVRVEGKEHIGTIRAIGDDDPRKDYAGKLLIYFDRADGGKGTSHHYSAAICTLVTTGTQSAPETQISPASVALSHRSYFTPVSTVTPLRQQYLAIKTQYPDALLMFRLGDFYEFFDDDARIAVTVCDLVMTTRPVSKTERVNMAGVPYYARDKYVAMLVKAGYWVAVCEQTTEPSGIGLVERKVIEVREAETTVMA